METIVSLPLSVFTNIASCRLPYIQTYSSVTQLMLRVLPVVTVFRNCSLSLCRPVATQAKSLSGTSVLHFATSKKCWGDVVGIRSPRSFPLQHTLHIVEDVCSCCRRQSKTWAIKYATSSSHTSVVWPEACCPTTNHSIMSLYFVFNFTTLNLYYMLLINGLVVS